MNQTLVIDFYSEYCAPCKKLMLDLENIKSNYSNTVFKKMNIEEHYDLVEKYKVMSVPTLVVLKNNEIQASYTGYKGLEDLKNFLDKSI